jgi:hypothetical protein
LGDSTVTRIITNGAGQPLDVGTATRVWPAAIRKAITDRDRGCRFDGCDRPAAWCDIDHVIPYSQGGPTAVDNGILLCRTHHRAKRRDGWWPTLHPDGAVTWTHSDGRTRTDPPPHTIDDHITTLTNASTATAAAAADAARAMEDPADLVDATAGDSSSAPSADSTQDDNHHGAHDTSPNGDARYRYTATHSTTNDAGPTTAGETRGTYHTGCPPPQRPPPQQRPPTITSRPPPNPDRDPHPRPTARSQPRSTGRTARAH